MEGRRGVGLIRGDGSTTFFDYFGGSYYAQADRFEKLTVVTSGGVTEYVVESADRVKRYFDNTLGLLKRIVDRTGREQTLTYADRDSDSVADELTSFDDGFGGVKSVTDPLGKTTTYTYDSHDRLDTITTPDPDGAGSLSALKVKYEYDTNGRLWKVSNVVVDPTLTGTPKTVYEYDSLGNLKKVTLPDPDGAGWQVAAVWDYTYDALGRLKTVTAPDPDAGRPGLSRQWRS